MKRWLVPAIAVTALLFGVSLIALRFVAGRGDLRCAQTMAFTTLMLFQISSRIVGAQQAPKSVPGGGR